MGLNDKVFGKFLLLVLLCLRFWGGLFDLCRILRMFFVWEFLYFLLICLILMIVFRGVFVVFSLDFLVVIKFILVGIIFIGFVI